MDLTIYPSKLAGEVTPPSSKSQAHRALIAAALGGGISTISNLADSQDIQATRRCLSALGALVEDLGPGTLRVHGLGNSIPQAGPFPTLDCGESGSTLRFLIPVALLVRGQAAFTGRGRLMERPLPHTRICSGGRGSAGAWSTACSPWTADGVMTGWLWTRGVSPAGGCVQSVYHRAALCPAPAGGETATCFSPLPWSPGAMWI
ncbi:MAG: hypothetical protein ACLUJG_03020 [Lawsonibacter sp.]